ncbi:MAG: AAA family ATPase [Phycisphaerae bacterium]|jgi:replication-associated recombination protein RarA
MTALTTFSPETLETLRRRRYAGESVKAMAGELGVTWQKLDKAIRNGFSTKDRLRADRKTIPAVECAQDAVMAILQVAPGTGALTEKYRPRTLDALWGQVGVVRALRAFLAAPFPTAFVFEGETGTGKTSAAIALAAELGCDLAQKPPEFGGLHVIASGEQTADTIRDIHNLMWRSPFSGSGWKVLIVNEADRMSVAAETIWLDRLESLPPKTVIIFTTNFPEKLSQRFRDRCTRLAFESDADRLSDTARNLVKAIWQRETGKAPKPDAVAGVVERATEDGKISLRRVVQVLSPMLLSEKAAKGGAQ